MSRGNNSSSGTDHPDGRPLRVGDLTKEQLIAVLPFVEKVSLSREGRVIGLRLGSARCHCPTCHHTFNSISSFDRHRVGGYQSGGSGRRCLSPEELRGRGWSQNKKGFWIERKRAVPDLDLPHTGGLHGQEPSRPRGAS